MGLTKISAREGTNETARFELDDVDVLFSASFDTMHSAQRGAPY